MRGFQGPAGSGGGGGEGGVGLFTNVSATGNLTQSDGSVSLQGLEVVLQPSSMSSNAFIKTSIVDGMATLQDGSGYDLNAWQSLAYGHDTYGNKLWIAVSSSGTGNRVMASTDGQEWIPQTSAADYPWSAVAFGDGLFVAVGDSGSGENPIMYSNDGATWTLGSAPSGSYKALVYGNNGTQGIWSAVGTTGSNMYSYDGINWMTDPSYLYNGNFTSVTYGGGVFVAVNSTNVSQRVMYTTDPSGVWTLIRTANNQAIAWQSVAYGDGTFVAVSNSGTNRTMTSPDGIVWTSGPSSLQLNWSSVIYANGYFVAVSDGGVSTMASIDGKIWTLFPEPNVGNWSSIAFGDNKFVTVASSGTVRASYAFATFTEPTFLSTNLNETDNSLQLQLGYDNTSQTNTTGNFKVNYNDYKLTWTSRQSAATNVWNDVAYGNGTYCAVGSSGPSNRVMVSSDGYTWTIGSTGVNVSNNWTSVVYAYDPTYGPTFVAVASSGTNRAMFSSNITGLLGKYWVASSVPPSNLAYNSVAYGNSYYVTVGDSAVAYSNSGGSNWTQSTPAANNNWRSVCFGTLLDGTDVFVAVSSNGTNNRVMRSTDYGQTWTSQTSAANNSWTDVAFGNNLFVAVSSDGSTNQIMTSRDGITWVLRTSPVSLNWQTVTYSTANGGLWIALSSSGTNNRSMTSVDGVTWTTRSTTNDNAWKSIVYSDNDSQFVAVANNYTGIVGGQVMTSSGIVHRTVLDCDITNNIVKAPAFFIGSTGSGGTGFAPACRSSQVKIDFGRYTGTANSGTITFAYTYTSVPSVTFGCDQLTAGTMYSVQITALTTTSFSYQRMSQTGATTSTTGSSFNWTAIGV